MKACAPRQGSRPCKRAGSVFVCFLSSLPLFLLSSFPPPSPRWRLAPWPLYGHDFMISALGAGHVGLIHRHMSRGMMAAVPKL